MVRSPPGARVPPGPTLMAVETGPPAWLTRDVLLETQLACNCLFPMEPPHLASRQPPPRPLLSVVRWLLTATAARTGFPRAHGPAAASEQVLERQGSRATFGAFTFVSVTSCGVFHAGPHSAAPRGQYCMRSTEDRKGERGLSETVRGRAGGNFC